MKILPLIIIVLIALGCADRPRTETSSNEATQSPANTAVASASKAPLSSTDSARETVGLDDGGKMLADENDIRVKRVRYLLEHLAGITKETEASIASQTDAASTMIENDYGKRVTRQKLLEDMNSFYSDPKMAKLGQKYSQMLTAQVILEYAN